MSPVSHGDNPERNKSLDGVRAIATLLIVIYHLFSVSGQTINNPNGLGQFSGRLNVAVSVFFVLSGYLLSKPFLEGILKNTPFPKPNAFYIKRIVRIMPAYWLALLILWKINAVNIPNTSGFIRNILLIHPLTVANVFSGITQTWTLSVELFYYLSLPWIALVIKTRTKNKSPEESLRCIFLILSTLYISSYLFRVFLHYVQIKFFETHAILLPAHIDTFALGMCIATATVALEAFPHLKVRRSRLAQMSPIFFFMSAATWFWSTQIGWGLDFNASPFRVELFGHFLYGISSFCLILPFCLDQGDSRIVKIMSSQILVWLGTISYGMYLWHFLFLDGHFANTHLPYQISDMGIATRMLITIPCSITLASISYYLIERPLLRTLNGSIRKRKILS